MSIAYVPSRPAQRRPLRERLPESDGKPMAETDLHLRSMLYLLDALEEYFREEPRVYVTGNIFFYYRDENGKLKRVAPDIFVVKGTEKKERRIYLLEEEGRVPDLVIELISRKTKLKDLGLKRLLYANLGVKEYFVFDPLQEPLSEQLCGFRLRNKKEYLPMAGSRLHSEVLNLDLAVEHGRLRLFDRRSGEYLRSHKEAEADRRAAEAGRHAAEAKTAQEAEARRNAEAELARLREELSKRKGKQA